MKKPAAAQNPARRPRGRPKSFNDKSDATVVQSLDRALSVLSVLAIEGGMTLTELARATEQSASTLYRLLRTFERHGVTEFDAAGQLWFIGAGAHRLGAAFLRRTNVVERARPALQSLMAQTGETANLGIERRGQVVFVSQVETHSAIRAFFPPGTESPMHASGIGKVLLAFLPDSQRARWLRDHPLTGFTPATHTDRAALVDDLNAIRARGYALDDEERTEGMRCIAAPIFDGFGLPIAGLSVSGPTNRMDRARIADFAEPVRAAAADVTRSIGGIDPADLQN